MRIKDFFNSFSNLSEEEKIREFFYFFNYIAIFPESYMLFNIVINEFKKNHQFPVFAIPYFIMLLTSAFIIDCDIENYNQLKLNKSLKKIN